MKKFIVIIGWCYSSHEEEKVFFSMADAKKFAKKIQEKLDEMSAANSGMIGTVHNTASP